jgi:hypothetical protein
LRLETKEGKMGIKMTGKNREKSWCGWFRYTLKDVFPISNSISNPSTLSITLKSENIKKNCTLIDSGSSVSFINLRFTLQNNLKLLNLKTLLKLMLFDGSTASSGHIYQYTDLNVEFPCGTHHSI